MWLLSSGSPSSTGWSIWHFLLAGMTGWLGSSVSWSFVPSEASLFTLCQQRPKRGSRKVLRQLRKSYKVTSAALRDEGINAILMRSMAESHCKGMVLQEWKELLAAAQSTTENCLVSWCCIWKVEITMWFEEFFMYSKHLEVFLNSEIES